MCRLDAVATRPPMISHNIHLLGLTFALSMGLSACEKEPVPDAVSTEDETEAGVMADDAVGLAEAALDNAVMSDGPAFSPTVGNQVGSANPDVNSEAEGNEATDN